MLALEVKMLPQAREDNVQTVEVHTSVPAPARRYAETARQMRAAGIDVGDDEYERIDALTSVEDALFLHLCGIAPFVARAACQKG